MTTTSVAKVTRQLAGTLDDSNYDPDGSLMIQVQRPGQEPEYLLVTGVQEGGSSPCFPYLTAVPVD